MKEKVHIIDEDDKVEVRVEVSYLSDFDKTVCLIKEELPINEIEVEYFRSARG